MVHLICSHPVQSGSAVVLAILFIIYLICNEKDKKTV